MQYINYPAKTLMKSSRVVFTMIFGVLIQGKVYRSADYLIVVAMVLGLATFMHADATSSAVFHHMGVIMLTISLFCDGAISNVSETIMNQFGVGQDEVRVLWACLFTFLHVTF
jgi:UAA transporter family